MNEEEGAAMFPLLDIMHCLRNAFLAGIKAVHPNKLIPKWLKREKDTISVGEEIYNLRDTYVVGFGKAVLEMLPSVVDSFKKENGSYIKKGIISIPHGYLSNTNSKAIIEQQELNNISVYEGAEFNLPDLNAQNTAVKILNLVKKLEKDDLLITLISGGGSALLPLPVSPLTLDEKRQVVRSLSLSGASISEINMVRRAVSATKGGKLAQSTKATIIALILCDAIENKSLDVIASGPTIENVDQYNAPFDVLKKYNIPISDNLKKALESRLLSASSSAIFPPVQNVKIGDNMISLDSAYEYLNTNTQMSCAPIILTSYLSGEASLVGKELMKFAFTILSVLSSKGDINVLYEFVHSLKIPHQKVKELTQTLSSIILPRAICLLFGGETTVHVKGSGRGGRNQEMVLSASLEIEKLAKNKKLPGEIVLLSGGTDGIDGPTDAAGAVTYYSFKNNQLRIQVDEAQRQDLSPQAFLDNNNSNEYFTRLSGSKYILKTGHTGTNVMDMQLLWIQHTICHD